MALVLYNAVVAAQNSQQAGIGHLYVAGQQMAQLCHNPLQRAILSLPGRDVTYIIGRITPAQVYTNRPSYVNGILIQRAGQAHGFGPCTKCTRNSSAPFTRCLYVPGHFGGACGSCKWRDHASRCLFINPHAARVDDDDDDDNNAPSDDDVVIVSGPPGATGRHTRPLPPAGAQVNPIVVE